MKAMLLDSIGEQWSDVPDMRLGQLIVNAVNYWCQQNGRSTNPRDMEREIFYAEDDDLLTTIAKFVQAKYPPKASTSF